MAKAVKTKAEVRQMPAAEKAPKFNPQSNYQWQAEDQFSVSGLELDILHKAVSAIVNTPEAQRVLAAYDALKITSEVIKRNVENGVIKEVPPAPQQ